MRHALKQQTIRHALIILIRLLCIRHAPIDPILLSRLSSIYPSYNHTQQTIRHTHRIPHTKLKSSSSPGPDGVPVVLLETTCKELNHPLYLLWRASLDQGVVPPDLLLVPISPVHKGGSRGLPADYRPVAL